VRDAEPLAELNAEKCAAAEARESAEMGMPAATNVFYLPLD